MKAAELRLRPAGGAFPGVDSALAALPGVTREGLTNLEWLADGSYALLYRLSGGTERTLRETLEDHDDVIEYDLVERAGGYFLFVHVTERETLSALLAVAEEHALLLDRPFAFTDDGIAVTAVGSSDALQAAFAEVTDQIPVTVEWTGGYVPGAAGVLDRLTARQREALQTASDLGFYETPRRASYDDIADALGCAPSTANELLRRAEATVVSNVLDA